MSRRLVILDRDGVINEDSDDFIKSPDEWIPIPGSLESIGRLSRAGFDVAVASNQSGIGRKLLDEPALELIHRKMREAARKFGGDIGKIEYCPHHPDAGCECRKPKPGMLLALSRKYGVPLNKVPFVGDSVRDVEAAIAVGARAILVRTGSGAESELVIVERGLDVEVFADLAAVVDKLVGDTVSG